MKKFMFAAFIFIGLNLSAQTAEELIGTWQLIGFQDAYGNDKGVEAEFNTTEVFQIFYDDHVFISAIGDEEHRGTWKLTHDNKEMEIDTESGAAVFKIVEFDANHRTISNGMLGTLHYVKIEDEE